MDRSLCPWGFSRQEYRSGLPRPPPRGLPDPGMKPVAAELLTVWVTRKLPSWSALNLWEHAGSKASYCHSPGILSLMSVFESGVWLACTCCPPLIPPRCLRECLTQAVVRSKGLSSQAADGTYICRFHSEWVLDKPNGLLDKMVSGMRETLTDVRGAFPSRRKNYLWSFKGSGFQRGHQWPGGQRVT